MRTRPLTLIMALAAGLLLLAAACKGGSGEKAVDDTVRDISNEQLQQMVLALGEFGQEFAGFRLDEDSGFRTAEEMAENDFDPEGEAQDLEQFGWVTAYEQNFVDPNADTETFDLFSASSDVNLFDTAEGAAGYLADLQDELAGMEGTTSAGLTVGEIETFRAEAAEDSFGYRMSGRAEDENGGSLTVSATGVILRHGRIVASVGVAAYGKVQADKKLRELAGVLDERIASVLAGTAASREPGGAATPEPLVSNAVEVLGASAERFQQEVSSLRGEAEFNMDIGGITMQGTATFAFQMPDRIYMTMEFTGGGQQDSGETLDLSGLGTVEMLMLGPDIYMKMPFLSETWGVMSLTDMGVDADQFREMTSNHSFVDYQALVEEMGANVEDLGEETVDGATYRHYRATLDLADALQAAKAVLGTDDMAVPSGLGGPMTIDFWIEPESLLPYKFAMTGEFGMQGQSMAFDMTARFFDYNQPVEIPPAPADAVPFDQLDLSGASAGP